MYMCRLNKTFPV